MWRDYPTFSFLVTAPLYHPLSPASPDVLLHKLAEALTDIFCSNPSQSLPKHVAFFFFFFFFQFKYLFIELCPSFFFLILQYLFFSFLIRLFLADEVPLVVRGRSLNVHFLSI